MDILNTINTTQVIDCNAFTFPCQASSYRDSVHEALTSPSGSSLRRLGWPLPHDVASVVSAHSRQDTFPSDNGLRPFDDRGFAISCTVTNHMVHTELSLWTYSLPRRHVGKPVHNIGATAVTTDR